MATQKTAAYRRSGRITTPSRLIGLVWWSAANWHCSTLSDELDELSRNACAVLRYDKTTEPTYNCISGLIDFVF